MRDEAASLRHRMDIGILLPEETGTVLRRIPGRRLDGEPRKNIGEAI